MLRLLSVYLSMLTRKAGILAMLRQDINTKHIYCWFQHLCRFLSPHLTLLLSMEATDGGKTEDSAFSSLHGRRIVRNPGEQNVSILTVIRACISSILGLIYRLKQDSSPDVAWNFAPEIVLV